MTDLPPWPDESQLLLLQAALDPGDGALQSFARWRARTNIDEDLDGGSFRLLPMVYANLSSLGCQDPLMGRLRGVYRHSWCEAQSHLARAAEVIGLLAARDIPVMASKGLVLATDYYDSPALRPMSDLDLTVPPERALEAIDILNAAGWTPSIYVNWVNRPQDMLILTSEVICRHERGGEVDLHWRMLNEFTGREASARFWGGAVPLNIGKVGLLRPSPTDLLFHVIIHGVQRHVVPPIRWIPDVAMILRRDGQAIDWDGLSDFARRMRLGNRLSQGLVYLRETVGLDIPVRVVGSRPTPPTLVERIENRLILEDSATLPPRLRAVVDNFRILLRLLLGDGRRHVPRLAFRWVARRLGVWAGA